MKYKMVNKMDLMMSTFRPFTNFLSVNVAGRELMHHLVTSLLTSAVASSGDVITDVSG